MVNLQNFVNALEETLPSNLTPLVHTHKGCYFISIYADRGVEVSTVEVIKTKHHLKVRRYYNEKAVKLSYKFLALRRDNIFLGNFKRKVFDFLLKNKVKSIKDYIELNRKTEGTGFSCSRHHVETKDYLIENEIPFDKVFVDFDKYATGKLKYVSYIFSDHNGNHSYKVIVEINGMVKVTDASPSYLLKKASVLEQQIKAVKCCFYSLPSRFREPIITVY